MACPMYDPNTFGLSGLTGLGILLSLVVSTIIYMVGKAIKRDYVELAKIELFNASVNVIIIASIALIVAAANVITCSVQGGSLFDLAIDHIYNVIYNIIYPMLETLMYIMSTSSFLQNLTLDMKAVKLNPLAGLSAFTSSINVVSFILETAFASLYIQSFLLLLFKEVAMVVLLPLAIALRAFPYMRDAGNFLIGLVFSLYIVYPFFYVYMYDVFLNDIHNQLDYDNIDKIVRNNIMRSPSMFSKIVSFFDAYSIDNLAIWGMSLANYSSLRDLVFGMGAVLFVSVAVPALNIILTVSIGVSISRFLKEVTPG